MAKKSFKENPALSFISQALAEAAQAMPADISDEALVAEGAQGFEAEAIEGARFDEQISTQADVYDDTHTYTHIDTSTDIHADAYTDADTSTEADMSMQKQTEVEAAFASAESLSTPKGTRAKAAPKSGSRTAAAPTAQEMFAGTSKESKSKRLQLLLRPSTHEGLSQLAKEYQTSVNDIVNQVLEEFLKRN